MPRLKKVYRGKSQKRKVRVVKSGGPVRIRVPKFRK